MLLNPRNIRRSRLVSLRHRIAVGRYHVDAHAVAEAFLRSVKIHR